MGLNFRKSIRIGKNTRINLSRKGGIGISTGIKGSRVSMNKQGTRKTIGAKGVYYTEQKSWKNKDKNRIDIEEQIRQREAIDNSTFLTLCDCNNQYWNAKRDKWLSDYGLEGYSLTRKEKKRGRIGIWLALLLIVGFPIAMIFPIAGLVVVPLLLLFVYKGIKQLVHWKKNTVNWVLEDARDKGMIKDSSINIVK
ncbi:DUF4236 domain-containing protein [Clostridium frigidicarnis]|uniref:DUF4236 domain-containing protein n=1 Tax=Clostridium frigidicarnis TaxID=84698 RepID=A0A1I0V465_9CLOT|nr:DUF4236 domain-containing protein [Clostridium frigidicarnis]SFA70346.1 Protein of unknown function [Clostridium frigidicarnis]